jgi:hypothetical protein
MADRIGISSCQYHMDLSTRIAVDPLAPNTIYAGTGFGIYKSINGGSNWTILTSGLPAVLVFKISDDPTNFLRGLRWAPAVACTRARTEDQRGTCLIRGSWAASFTLSG